MPRERELRRLKRKVYVDSHGQSEIGFAITRLLDFDLLARIKQINKIKTSPLVTSRTSSRGASARTSRTPDMEKPEFRTK